MHIALPILLLSLLAGSASAAEARSDSTENPAGRMPFRLDRGRVILPVRVAGSEPLDLILDTGMSFDGIYLFHQEALSGLEGVELMEVRVPGAGSGEPSTARMAESLALECGDMRFEGQRVIVSTSERTQGFPTGGIIGWTVLGHYVTRIDYDAEVMTLFDPGRYAPDSSWQRIDLVLRNNIPWIDAALAVEKGEAISAQAYIDLAAEKAVDVLVGPGKKFSAPEGLENSYLGTGLSGDIHGGVGKVALLRIGPFDLRDLSAAFPEAAVRSKQQGADIVLGSDAIRRFNAVFDYAGGGLYLRPSKYFEGSLVE